MTSNQPTVTVCVCTFQRPQLLRRLLDGLARQKTDGLCTFSIVVADNDSGLSAKPVVADFAATAQVDVVYTCEPNQNIALARNRALCHATGDFVAFIDDDELPETDWLTAMLVACNRYQVAGVLGPVRPHFDRPPPRWIINGRFCERPEHPTGRVMNWEESRTGNVLFRRRIVQDIQNAFDPLFGSGGEDKDFFMRMTALGHVFCWCNEGVVYESVPEQRCTRAYMLKRAMLRGQNIIKHPMGRGGLLMRSVIAAPLYLMILPFSILLGQHVFMKYCIKFCDHFGRILALFGVNPVYER